MTEHSAAERLAAAAEQIWLRSRPLIDERVATLEEAAFALLEGRLDDAGRAHAEREAHKLAGSAGTLGLRGASEVARDLEALLQNPTPAALAGRRAAELVETLAVLVAKGPAYPQARAALAPSTTPTRESSRLTDTGREPDRDAADTPIAPGSGPSGRPGKAGLLVAGGDTTTRRALARAATSRGERVRTTSKPASAAQVLDEEAADALLVLAWDDVPDADAVDVLRGLGQRFPAMRMILAAESLTTPDRLALTDAGVDLIISGRSSATDLIEAAIGSPAPGTLADATVLFVDDDPALLMAVHGLLAGSELRAVSLDDPLRLFETLEQESPDLLVLDIDMPGVDGHRLCRLVRRDERWRRLPVLFLSGSTDPDRVRAVFDAGADDFVAKPIAGPELIARIRHRLERVTLLRRLAEQDPLTGLPTRACLQVELAALIGRPGGSPRPLGTVLLDVDGLKAVNTEHGHAAGDLVVQELAARLREALPDHLLARVGGDEFMAVLAGVAPEEVGARVGAVLAALGTDGVQVSGGRLHPRASAGVEDAAALSVVSFETAYRAANAALLRAKSLGGGRVIVGTPPTDERGTTVDVVVVEDDEVVAELLRHAVDAAGFSCLVLTDGQQALDRLTSGPDLVVARSVLLDVDLPSRNGIEVLRGLRRAGVLDRTRVTLVTARTSEHDVTQAMREGAVDHIAKPFSIPILVHKLKRTLAA